MRDIEDDVRRARRKRLLAHGAAAEYGDPRIYAAVDSVLRRAIDARDHEALLLPELVGGDEDSRLTTHLRFASHRPVLGAMMIFAKRRILLPAMRWLYEYSLHNFQRQDRLNHILFACLEELAIENAKLRVAIGELTAAGGTGARGRAASDGPASGSEA